MSDLCGLWQMITCLGLWAGRESLKASFLGLLLSYKTECLQRTDTSVPGRVYIILYVYAYIHVM